MDSIIRPITEKDKQEVLEMMRVFYASEAVFSNGSDEIFSNDIDTCIKGSPYFEGYVIENENGTAGYTMVAKSFSAEFGKMCIWIEDLYIKPEHRGKGLGNKVMEFITSAYTDCIFRLEVEPENTAAVNLYKKHGFTVLPYTEMKK